MLQKVKKERREKENRANLKMFTSLLEKPSIAENLYKNYQTKNLINSLRVATVIEFNYLISTYF